MDRQQQSNSSYFVHLNSSIKLTRDLNSDTIWLFMTNLSRKYRKNSIKITLLNITESAEIQLLCPLKKFQVTSIWLTYYLCLTIQNCFNTKAILLIYKKQLFHKKTQKMNPEIQVLSSNYILVSLIPRSRSIV